MKEFLITAAAVVAGIWIYSRLTRGKRMAQKLAASSIMPKDGAVLFSPLDRDPVTGGALIPGAKAGTVEFSAQNN